MGWKDTNDRMKKALRSLNGAVPDTAKAFGALGKAVKAPTSIDVKQAEFVALGIAVAVRCEPCIGFHVDALVKLGATREEIADVLSMCIQMGGGPSLMYAAKALECYDEFSGATET